MQFLTPKNINEASEMLRDNPSYKIVAGGTDLCVQLKSGLIESDGLISLWGIDDLGEISEKGDSIKVGALATHSDIINNELIQKYLPALAGACKTIGARQIQNRGTIGGNVMNASPAGDALPVLLAYDTSVMFYKAGGGLKEVGFDKFYTGYRKTVLKKGEIVAGFKISKADHKEKSAFMKIGTRKAQAISKVMGCFRILLDGDSVKDVQIAFGSVAPVPIRLNKTEEFIKGGALTDDNILKAAQMALDEVTPIDDIRSTGLYRQHICGVLVKRFLESL